MSGAERTRISVFLVAALAVAGCLGAPPPNSATANAALGGWHLDCSLGVNSVPQPWPQACLVRASHTDRTKAETWVGVNPKDPANVVLGAKDMNPDSSANCVWNGVWVTHDAGRTWKDVTIGGKYVDRAPGSPFYGFACNTDAMFAFSADGTLHFGVEMYNAGGATTRSTLPASEGGEILLATSHDGGDTWPDVITFEPPLVFFSDYSRMTVDPKSGAIFEAINGETTAGDIECDLLASRDDGKTADPPVRFTTPQDPGQTICRGVGVSPKDGTVVVGFKGGDPGWFLAGTPEYRSFFARSTDGGRTFTDVNEAFTYKENADPFPNMKAPSRAGQEFEMRFAPDGTLWVITSESPVGDANIFVRSSKDDGKTWSQPAQVNDPKIAHEQWLPQLVFAGDGSMHAFYFDRGYGDGHLVDITHSVSFDDGKTWTSERVTTVSWDPDLGRHQDGFPWIGDYIGAAAIGNDIWVGVPDTSLGEEPVIAAAHVTRT